MPDMHASNVLRQALLSEFDLERRLDALACGECTVDAFVSEALSAFGAEAGSHPNLLSGIDQYYRRGQLPAPIFHAIKSQITQHAIECAIDDLPVTIELFPASRPVRADAVAPPESIEQLAEAAGPQDPSSALVSNPSIPPGKVLGERYAVESLLGRGGMGDVFKVSDGSRPLSADADRHVALKVLRDPIDQYPELLARLQHEFDCTRRLMHPNIVKVYDFVQDDSIAFYTMELLEGERLCDLIRRAERGTLPRAYAWAIIGGVGAALAHAHSRHVIHGDVSAKNVMITRRGELRVLDFGSSRTPSQFESSSGADEERGAIAATPAYASCELLEGHQADPRDDIYSLACLACELLGGTHPFQGRRSTEARDLKMNASRPPGVSFFQWRAIQRGLSWSRAARPATIREWLADLGLEPEPDRLPPIDGTVRSRPRARFAQFAVQAAVSLCALVGVFLVWHAINRHSGKIGSEVAATAPVESPVGTPPASDMEALPPDAPALSDPHSPQGLSPANRLNSVPALASSASSSAAKTTPQQPRSRLAKAAPVRHSTIKFTAHRYAVRPGTSFAELRLLRSHASGDMSNFVWWTEDSSARAGVDFVAQNRASHAFSGESPVATVFVRLLPNVARTQTTSFQVCAGKPSGTALIDVTCSAVVLPADRS